jgi:trehalose synthase
MVHLVEPKRRISLDDYEAVAHLNGVVRELRRDAGRLTPGLKGRRVWMLNSTEQGGGVAEMMPTLIGLLRELGADARWLVMDAPEPAFFQLTKRLHNLIHGEGEPRLDPGDRDLYDRVSQETADAVAPHLAPGDLLLVHDPQPMGAGAVLRGRLDIAAIWRCHIGLDRDTPQTEAAWAFLGPAASAYDAAVFTAPEYIPRCLAGRATIIYPGLDPLSHKNRDLPIHKLVGVLANAALIAPADPMLTRPFGEPARRLRDDGGWTPASEGDDIGLLYRPIATQVSRWDRLKGFLPLMQGFAAMKQAPPDPALSARQQRTLSHARLVLAGPDPSGIQDDPEGRQVLAELASAYVALPPETRADVAVLALPMASRKQNALMVNALQRCSDIVVQNSLQEGFGLTATEAMWKRIAVMGTPAAGLRQQIRDGVDGLLVRDPQDPEEISRTLAGLFVDPHRRDLLARAAQQRVYDEFLVFNQVRRWLEALANAVRSRWREGVPR